MPKMKTPTNAQWECLRDVLAYAMKHGSQPTRWDLRRPKRVKPDHTQATVDTCVGHKWLAATPGAFRDQLLTVTPEGKAAMERLVPGYTVAL